MHTSIKSYTGQIAALERQLNNTPLHHILTRVKLSRRIKTLQYIESNPKAFFAAF